MSDDYRTFQKFTDPELAKIIIEKLDAAAISNKLVTEKPVIDTNIIGTSYLPDHVLKLRPEDFVKAHKVLEQYYAPLVDSADPDYYLFSFSKNELIEIMARPDEWGVFDYQLARKILKEKNVVLDDATLDRLKRSRNEELAKPEPSAIGMVLFGYLCVGSSVYGLISLLRESHLPYPLLALLGCFAGHQLYRSTKTLPDGRSVPAYNPADSMHGKIIFFTACALLAITTGIWLRLIGIWYSN